MATITAEERRDAAVPRGRDELAFMLCGLWMVIGLYIDGWAHEADRPETFFTPWHGVLYSGFGAAMLYGFYTGLRDRGRSRSNVDDKITAIGVAVFLVGAGGDAAWHELVGVEVDLEALVSPTHLMLMIGGLLMVTLPVRAALESVEPLTRELKTAVMLSVGLALAVVAFFLMYLSPWAESDVFRGRYVGDDRFSNLTIQTAMATVTVASVLFSGALLWLARRWTLPFGTATVMFTAVALAQSGLEGFDVRLPVLAATAAGLVADVLLAGERQHALVGGAIGGVLWASYFALLHVEDGVEWSPSLWVGAIVFGALAGYAAALVISSRGSAPEAAA